jgi:hypothetical protein
MKISYFSYPSDIMAEKIKFRAGTVYKNNHTKRIPPTKLKN